MTTIQQHSASSSPTNRISRGGEQKTRRHHASPSTSSSSSTTFRLIGFVVLILLVAVNLCSLHCPMSHCITTSVLHTDEKYNTNPGDNFVDNSNGHARRRRQAKSTHVSVNDPHHILPTTLYVVYGLEGSGTTLMTDTLAKALKLPVHLRSGHDTVESMARSIHIQHLSLPMGARAVPDDNDDGSRRQQQQQQQLPIVDVFLPKRCHVATENFIYTAATSSSATVSSTQEIPIRTPEVCRSFVGPTMPAGSNSQRYFVNVTSHVQWYRDRGVIAYPVLVVRDPSYRYQSVIQNHEPNRVNAIQQYTIGQHLIEQSICEFAPPAHGDGHDDCDRQQQPSLVIVSYESLMTIGSTYLTHMIYPQLGIYDNDNDMYTPMLKNGNLKYTTSTNALNDHLLQLEQPFT
jgi:hypothetical protein